MENCELCKSQEFKYTCPRCNIKYCSLSCYRSENHSTCSEAFYKECVVNELKDQHANQNDTKNFIELLQKIETEHEDPDGSDENLWVDSDDSEIDESDLYERLNGIDLNNADDIWDKLTKDEKEEFKSIVYNGEIDKIVEPVKPWWKQKLEIKPVSDVDEDEKKLKTIIEACPPVLENIKKFTEISTKKPASCIPYNIGNIIGAYWFYNGDHISYALEATNNFISISNNLKLNANFEDLVSSVDTIILNCHTISLYADNHTKEILLEDVHDVFNGPSSSNTNEFASSVVSDVINLFEAAKKNFKKTEKGRKASGFSSEFAPSNEDYRDYPELRNQSHLTGCIKKLEFYLSFLKHCEIGL